MSEQPVIDALEFARGRGRLDGRLGVADPGRLTDTVADVADCVAYTLTGDADAQGRPLIRVAVHGVIGLTCQRCLGRIDHRLAIESALRLVGSEAELPDLVDESQDVDVVVAEAEMNVADLIEQEIVLSLPYAPAHGESCSEAARELAPRPAESPFAALAALKTSS